MVNGITLYNSKDPALALAACQESERQSAHTDTGLVLLKCYPPGAPRVLATDTEDLDATQFATSQTFAALLLFCAAIFLFITCWEAGSKALQSIQSRILQQIANLPRIKKQVIIATSDVIVILVSLWLAFVLRQEHIVLPDGKIWWLFIVAPLLAIPVFIKLGLYRAITRYLGVHAAATIFKSVVLYIALLALAGYLLHLNIPRTVLVAHGLMTLFLIGTTRLIARYWFNQLQLRGHASINGRHNVLIYGAGSAGVQLASALEFSRELRPVAFIDDAPELHKQLINGLKVYAPESFQELLTRFSITEILLAMPSAQRSRRNEIMKMLEPLEVGVRTLPGLDQLAQGTVKIDDLREVGIEDLLGRDPVPADPNLLQKNITEKSILVTGAGGSIGSELCRQILSLKPKCLVLYERNEFSLYSIENELLSLFQNNGSRNRPQIIPILGSITDQTRLERVLTRFNVQTVFHAAAYKHVCSRRLNLDPGCRLNSDPGPIVAV